MITIPVYNMIILPNISLTFKKDFFDEESFQLMHTGDSILFLFQKNEKRRAELTAEDFYPIGLSARIESIDDDNDVTVRTDSRMDISQIEISESDLFAQAVIRGDTEDVEREERRQRLNAMRNRLYEFVQRFPWGLMARAYLNRWKSLEECATALSSYLNLGPEEKYR